MSKRQFNSMVKEMMAIFPDNTEEIHYLSNYRSVVADMSTEKRRLLCSTLKPVNSIINYLLNTDFKTLSRSVVEVGRTLLAIS
jgi:hypothetical protein